MNTMLNLYNEHTAQFVQWTHCSIFTMDTLISLYNGHTVQFVKWTHCSVCAIDTTPSLLTHFKITIPILLSP